MHRLRLTRIENDDLTAAREGLSRLRNSSDFRNLITVLEQELVEERDVYEKQPASEHQRGQIVMLKKVLSLMIGDRHDDR